jgi:hypothetical protein
VNIVAISIDIKNPTEVLACYGILALDFLVGRQITRSRFVERMSLEAGQDGKLRSGTFEFEHPDFAGFLNRCRDMKLSVNSKREVSIVSDGKIVLTLDWYLEMFVGDSGNFSQKDKLDFVQTHQQSLSTVVEALPNLQDCSRLFSTAVEMPAKNFLSSYNSRKKGYLDAGGTYEADDVFYASEWFLLVALQVFRHLFEKHLRLRYRLQYSIFTEWLSTNAAFAAAVGAHHSCRTFESSKRKFGKGSVLRVAQEV